MAKQKVNCSICGGSHDGTPSGIAKHGNTLKHEQAFITLSDQIEDEHEPFVTEATCQGCHQCKWGAIAPCPSQTSVWHRASVTPERPTDLIVGFRPHMSDEEIALAETIREGEQRLTETLTALDKAEKDLRYWEDPKRAGKVGERGMENKRTKIAREQAVLGELEERVAALKSAKEELSQARWEVAQNQRESFEAYVLAAFPLPEGITLIPQGSSWRVAAAENTFYSADVYLPEERYDEWDDEANKPVYKTIPAYASWGGYGGGQKDQANARLLHQLNGTAIELADFINDLYGLTDK